MRNHENRLRRLEVVRGGQYLPCCILVPDSGDPGRDAVLAQVASLRKQGRMVIELTKADEHLALAELVEVFAP